MFVSCQAKFLNSWYNIFMLNKLTTFSKNLKYYRKKKGLSQYDLADKSGISQRMIAHYEKHSSKPPLSKVEILAITLGIKTSDLINDPDIKFEEIDTNDFDMRSLKKLKDILSLSQNDRASVYRLINTLLRKNQLEAKEKNKSLAGSSKSNS
jgi:transcriptional regulator with XRE-family HTH domain